MQGQRLIQSLIMASILTPNIAWSFTMADMEVNSALNQKLDTDIPLRMAANEKPRDISVRLAAPSIFDQHKINRVSLLDKIQFKRIGTAIQITSNSPINVPTLEFILEINSRKGTSYQHYIISLNKNPAVNKAVSHPIQVSKTNPVAIEANKTSAPVATNTNPKPVAIPIATIAERLNNDNTFGPLQKTDSLAKIAKHIAKIRNIKTKIVQTALRKNNPNAFYKGAHGALIPGEFLVIPDFNTAKPLETSPVTATATPASTPAVAIAKADPINNAPATAATASPAKDIVVQQLLTRVDRLEQHVEQMQKEINALQAKLPALNTTPVVAQPAVNPPASAEATQPATPPAAVETETPANPPAPVETPSTTDSPATTKEEANPVANSETETDANKDSESENPLLDLNNPWLLGSLATVLLGLLAWLTIRVVKAKRAKKAETPTDTKAKKKPKPKKTPETKKMPELTEEFDELDTDLLTPEKDRAPSSISNIPMDDSMNMDDLTEDDFEFDFLKSQANTSKAKKLKRPSTRYPEDGADNQDN